MATLQTLEYFQIKAILKCRLKAFQGISVSVPENPLGIPISRASVAARSITARRFHQRGQFIDRLLRDVAHAIAVLHAGDVTPFTTARISSRKSVRNRRGSRDSLATRAINPVIRIWHAIIFPFNSSILRSPFGRGRMNERHRPRNADGFGNIFRSVREMRAAGELRARYFAAM